MKLIALTKGKYAAVDDADYGWLMKFRWYAKQTGKMWYACTTWGGKNFKMHRLLCPFEKGWIDHINRNGLWNSRSNLRPATRSQNQANRGKNAGKWYSKFKGVTWDKSRNRWHVNAGGTHGGRFTSEIEAAKAYDRIALAKWGEFAWLNFPA